MCIYCVVVFWFTCYLGGCPKRFDGVLKADPVLQLVRVLFLFLLLSQVSSFKIRPFAICIPYIYIFIRLNKKRGLKFRA